MITQTDKYAADLMLELIDLEALGMHQRVLSEIGRLFARRDAEIDVLVLRAQANEYRYLARLDEMGMDPTYQGYRVNLFSD